MKFRDFNNFDNLIQKLQTLFNKSVPLLKEKTIN